MKKSLILLITVLALFMCYPTEGLAQKQQSSLNTPSVSQSRNKNTKILEDVYISVKDIISGKVDKEYLKKKKFKKIFKSVTEYPHDDMKFTYEVWGYNIEYDDENVGDAFCYKKEHGYFIFSHGLCNSCE